MIRIATIGLLAAALMASSAGAAAALYRCALNVDVVANYSPDAKSVTVYVRGQTFQLPIALSGSGAKYSNGKTTLWEHQGAALFETPGASFSGCKVMSLSQ
jgi:membrane-bound inhibitor of C-type lysozyme